jgi:hypothetical protein
MSKITFTLNVDLEQCITAVQTFGHELTPIIVSEPGVGKSTILKVLKERMNNDEYDYHLCGLPRQGHDGRCGIHPQPRPRLLSTTCRVCSS